MIWVLGNNPSCTEVAFWTTVDMYLTVDDIIPVIRYHWAVIVPEK
jgi:hypothetical protein